MDDRGPWRIALDAGAPHVEVRALEAGTVPHDDADFGAITLHRAYAPLAQRGWNFTATDQPAEATRRRCAGGTTLLGRRDGRIVATVTVRTPTPERECAWFRRAGVFSFERFAVDPSLHGRGREAIRRRLYAEEKRRRRLHADARHPW